MGFYKFLTNTENTAYLQPRQATYPCAGQPSMPRYLLLFWRKNLSNSFAFDNMDNGFQGTRNIGGINALDALGEQLDLVFSGEKDLDSALKDAQAIGEKAMEEARNN